MNDRFAAAVAFAHGNESSWPRDLEAAGSVPGLTEVDLPPWNTPLGPYLPRSGPNGLVSVGATQVAQWGDIERLEMTFSVAKSYLAVLAGLALDDGRFSSLDAPVCETVPGELFASEHNRSISWRHLLQLTSEWEGSLWDRPDLVDRNRQLGPGSDNSRKGQHRDLHAPGSYWEYNDVRVNLLSLCLLHAFGEPLPSVLKRRVMDPIGASDSWRWLGYDNSFVDIGGTRMQSVPGGTHWGGGIHISSRDHARLAQLVLADGAWHGRQVLPAGWSRCLATPCPINDGYGLLWWLNTGRRAWPAASANAYAAVGAGSHLVLIDPDYDLVLVARWVEQAQVPGLVERVIDAIR